MTEAEILALTYEDICTVYRPFKDNLGNGETVFKSGLSGKVIYKDIPCALSGKTGGKLYKSQSTAKAECDYSLFVMPDVDIFPNDTVIVLHLGKTIIAYAGLADRMESHCNVPLRLGKETV